MIPLFFKLISILALLSNYDRENCLINLGTAGTIDFLLTAKRDAAAAKRFFRKVFRSSSNPIPQVINVDKNPAYTAAIRRLKREGILPRRVRLRQCKYLDNIVSRTTAR